LEVGVGAQVKEYFILVAAFEYLSYSYFAVFLLVIRSAIEYMGRGDNYLCVREGGSEKPCFTQSTRREFAYLEILIFERGTFSGHP